MVDTALEKIIDPPRPWTFHMLMRDPHLFVKLANAQHHTQMKASFIMDNPLEVSPTYILKLHAI